MERFERYLKEQTRLLRERLGGPAKRTKPRRSWSERLESFHTLLDTVFKLSIALFAAVVVGGMVYAILSAMGSTGVVVQPLSVSTGLQDRGLTGVVLAQRFVDHWNFMVQNSRTVRPSAPQRMLATRPLPPNEFQVAPPDVPLKVDFPDTGLSVGEIYTFFRSVLSHEKFFTGEAYDNADIGNPKYVLTLRTGDTSLPPCSSSKGGMEQAIDEVAGCVFQRLEPYHYALYITSMYDGNKGGDACTDDLPPKQARNFLEAYLNANPLDAPGADGKEIARASDELGYRFEADCGDYVRAIEKFKIAQTADRNYGLAYSDLVDANQTYGDDEAALQDMQDLLRELPKLERHGSRYKTGEVRRLYQAELLEALGGFEEAARRLKDDSETFSGKDPDFGKTVLDKYLADFALARDLPGLRAAWKAETSATRKPPASDMSFLIARQFEQWPAAKALADSATDICDRDENCVVERKFYPEVMEVDAHLGIRMKASEEDSIPKDSNCYACLNQRGVKYALQWRQWDGAGLWFNENAARWFAAAIKAGPSLPFAHVRWAELLLKQKRYDRAIAELSTASRLAPNYAEVPALWAEVLLAMGRPADALAKLKDAEKDAPNWQRVHVLEAEALLALNRPAEAEKQKAMAQALGFTDQDRATFGLSCVGECRSAAH